MDTSQQKPSVEQEGRAAVCEKALERHVTELCACGERLSGTEGEQKACDYIVRELKAAGLSPEVHTLKGLISLPLDARVTVTFPEIFDVAAIGVSFGLSTPPEGVSAPLVDVGGGAAADYAGKDTQGKIALVDNLPRGALAIEALRHGCVGMICRSKSHRQHRLIISPVWGSPSAEEYVRLPRIPVASVNAEDGKRLAELCLSGEARVTLYAKNDEGWREMPLPSVEIKGRRPEFLLVGSHYCSWYDGATDNATGNSSLIELAKLFWKHRDSLTFGVRFCWWPGHSQGRYAGSTWYADTFHQELSDRCVAYFNIDSPGVRGATVYVPQDEMAEIAAFNENCIRELAKYSSLTTHQGVFTKRGRPGKYINIRRPNRSADQSFWGVGLTSISIYSMVPPTHPDFCTYASGCGGAWWWHSIDDTLDKMDPAVLAEDTRIFWTAMYRLCTSPVLPYDFAATAGDYLDALREYAEAAGTAMDFVPLRDNLEQLKNEAAAFAQKTSGIAEEDAAVRIVRTQLALCRTLIPTLYTEVDSTEQQPSVPARLLPLLQDALLLEALPETGWKRQSLLVGLKKRLNRVNKAVLAARRLLAAAY